MDFETGLKMKKNVTFSVNTCEKADGGCCGDGKDPNCCSHEKCCGQNKEGDAAPDDKVCCHGGEGGSFCRTDNGVVSCGECGDCRGGCEKVRGCCKEHTLESCCAKEDELYDDFVDGDSCCASGTFTHPPKNDHTCCHGKKNEVSTSCVHGEEHIFVTNDQTCCAKIHNCCDNPCSHEECCDADKKEFCSKSGSCFHQPKTDSCCGAHCCDRAEGCNDIELHTCCDMNEGSCLKNNVGACCDHRMENKVPASASQLCIAILRQNRTHLDVFDSRGRTRTFKMTDHDLSSPVASPSTLTITEAIGPKDWRQNWHNQSQLNQSPLNQSQLNQSQLNQIRRSQSRGSQSWGTSFRNIVLGTTERLCFSSHGSVHGVDGSITQCFDEKGEHGTPITPCPCELQQPHIHAHQHNPTICGNLNKGKKDATKKSINVDFEFLSELTFVHVETKNNSRGSDDDDCDFDRKQQQLARGSSSSLSPETQTFIDLPVNDFFPKECNSKTFTKDSKDAAGITLQKPTIQERRFKVKHDDHFDYLVRDFETEDMRLQHSCHSCGDNDMHGVIKLVAKRLYAQGTSESEIHVHFFEVPKHPFNNSSALFSDSFNARSDRVDIIRTLSRSTKDSYGTSKKKITQTDNGLEAARSQRKLMKESRRNNMISSRTAFSSEVRSQFFVQKICCASEIPAIKSIIEPLPGVSKVMINTTTKNVYVDHDYNVITASIIQSTLNDERFGATLKKDGGAIAMASTSNSSSPRVGISQFSARKICCRREIPAIERIIEPLPGVSGVSVNVITKTIYVDHNTDKISAVEILRALNDERFDAHLTKDAAQDFVMRQAESMTSFVESTILVAGSKLQNDHDNRIVAEVFASFPQGFIHDHHTNITSGEIAVEHNPYLLSATSLAPSLNKRKLDVSVVKDGVDNGKSVTEGNKTDAEDFVEESYERLSPFVILSGICWAISMFSLLGGKFEYVKYVGLLSVVFGLPPIALKAYSTIRRLEFDTNCLTFFAAIGAVALQEYAEAGAVSFLFAISETLEVRATARARNALSAIVNLRPEYANVINPASNEIMTVPAGSVIVGTLVSVRPGDKIPCDGVVVEGSSTVDESSLTGESRPVQRNLKDEVSGGTVNSGSSQLVVRTTATMDNSAVARLIRLVEEAQANRSPTEKLVDEFAKRYTPIVILAAVSMCTIPWFFGREIGREWTFNGLIIMVIACPCALIISTPVTYVAGLAAAAQRGIIIKGGSHLEALGSVSKICFDKTGTLTEGNFALLHLNVVESKRERKEVLEYLALMESRSSHPLAAALIAAAKNEGVSLPRGIPIQNHTILKGEGVSAIVNGTAVYVGNPRLFERLGLYDKLPESEKSISEGWAALGGTVGFISIDGEGIVGSYCVADGVRPESKSVIASLCRLKIESTMLTGDSDNAAIAIGKQVGLKRENIKSQLLPEDKLRIVSAMKDERQQSKGALDSALFNCFKARGLILMCGDGVNDAPALALADVGVAMGAGAALAMETSDMTLMDSNLNKLLYGIKMGRRVIRVIQQNVAFSLISKFLVMGLTLASKASLWAAIATDVGAMLIVTVNGMRLLPSRKEKAQVPPMLPSTTERTERGLEDEYSSHSYHALP